jgi:hypothetical protein
MSELLFALTGHPRSGKSLGGRYLQTTHGFQQFTGSELLIAEAAEQGLELRERRDYGDFQRKLRVERGLQFVTDYVLKLPHPRKTNVGIRNRFDVDAHKEAGGIIIALHCPLEQRFERRNSDPKYPNNLEDFAAAEQGEYDDPDPLGQHVLYAMEEADYWIDTAKSKDHMFEALDQIVAVHLVGQQR